MVLQRRVLLRRSVAENLDYPLALRGMAAPDRRDEFLVQALQLAREPVLSAQLGREGCATVRRLGWERIVERVEAEYLQALARGPRPQAMSPFLPRPSAG